VEGWLFEIEIVQSKLFLENGCGGLVEKEERKNGSL
jgi:hypothetical protein